MQAETFISRTAAPQRRRLEPILAATLGGAFVIFVVGVLVLELLAPSGIVPAEAAYLKDWFLGICSLGG